MKTLLTSFKLTIFVSLLLGTLHALAGRDGGGGNTLNGKPIESYVGDVTKYASYKKMIVPLLEKIDRKVPNFSGEMKRTITDKIWYFVPVRLNRLPNKITGIQFPSDQTIVQTEKAVWVDKVRFDALVEREQGILELHELVMGSVMIRRNSVITDNDSDLVRATTIYLMAHSDDSADALKAKLYDIEPFYPTAYDGLIHGNDPMGRLYELLQGLKADHELPNEHVYYGPPYGATDGALESICVSQISSDPANGTLTVSTLYRRLGFSGQIISDGTPTGITVSGRPEVATYDTSFGAGSVPNVSYTLSEVNAKPKDGEIRKALTVVKYGIGNTVDGLHITYQICRDSEGSGKCNWEQPSEKELKARSLSHDDERTCASQSFSKTNID